MVKVGDIFVATWGYDQTNANFFQVVKVGAKSVSVREIKGRIDNPNDQSMTGSSLPIKNSFKGAPKTRKLYEYSGEPRFNAGDSMGSARPWNGRPVAVSWYG